jgi:anti-sigma regulatory factor (Ser/Thr protein kinase)
MNVTSARPVTGTSQVAEGRRLALWLASQLGFSEERAGQAALIASELGTNLAKHARGGELLVRPLTTADDGSPTGIEILSLDTGPGMPEVAAARRDGYSTAGTLGHGLGAIERQADQLDLYTHTSGTAIAARIWRERPPADPGRSRFEVGAVRVSKAGEDVCGDDWAWRQRDGRLAIFIADGLGHGLHAHDASTAATRVFAAGHEQTPRLLISDVHAALRPTRGAAVAMLAVDLERRTGTFAGLGNIVGQILLPSGGRHNLVSYNGTAGHSAGRIHEFTYPVPPQATIVMFSDGLASHWDLTLHPGLASKSPALIAGVLYRDYSRRRDDVTVVVARERRPIAENQ